MTKEASWWEGGAGDRQPWPEAPAGTGTGTFPFGVLGTSGASVEPGTGLGAGLLLNTS